MLEQAKTVAEERGYRVVALAPYAAHVRVLREHGVEAKTLASFLAAREKGLDEKTALVIDEAGTVPTRQMEQALKLAEQAGARVVLLGDTGQTKAIEAGRPFDQLQAAGMKTALMSETSANRTRSSARPSFSPLAARAEPPCRGSPVSSRSVTTTTGAASSQRTTHACRRRSGPGRSWSPAPTSPGARSTQPSGRTWASPATATS